MAKEINIFWVGSQRLPFKYYQFIKRWKQLNPKYTVNFITSDASLSVKIDGVNTVHWQEASIDRSDERQLFLESEVLRAIDEKAYATASNILRQFKMFNDGGYYFDTDIIPLNSLNDVSDETEFLAHTKRNRRDKHIYGTHRMAVYALYGKKGSVVLNASINRMYNLYKQKSLQDVIKEKPDEFDFQRSRYTASLMMSETVVGLYPESSDYQPFVSHADITQVHSGAFEITQDGSWGNGLQTVLSDSEKLAATKIQRAYRLFKSRNEGTCEQQIYPWDFKMLS